MLVLLVVASCVCIAFVEVLKRKFSLPTALTRRLTHIGTAMVAGAAPLFVGQKEIIIVSLIFAGVLFVSRRYNLFSSIHTVDRVTFGEVFLPLGVALAALLFLPHDLAAFQFGVLVMGISDALAGFVGERFGKHSISLFKNKKSIKGSLAFLISTGILTFLFLPEFGYQLLLIPLTLTFTEFLLIYGLDNLFLPIVAGLLFQIF